MPHVTGRATCPAGVCRRSWNVLYAAVLQKSCGRSPTGKVLLPITLRGGDGVARQPRLLRLRHRSDGEATHASPSHALPSRATAMRVRAPIDHGSCEII